MNRLVRLERSGPKPLPIEFNLWHEVHRALAKTFAPFSRTPNRPCSPAKNCSRKPSDQRGCSVAVGRTAAGKSGNRISYHFCQTGMGDSFLFEGTSNFSPVQNSINWTVGVGSTPASNSLQPCKIVCRRASGSSVAMSIFRRASQTSATANESNKPIDRTR